MIQEEDELLDDGLEDEEDDSEDDEEILTPPKPKASKENKSQSVKQESKAPVAEDITPTPKKVSATNVKEVQQRRRDGSLDKSVTETINKAILNVARGASITKDQADTLLRVLKPKVDEKVKSSFGTLNQKQALEAFSANIEKINKKDYIHVSISKSIVRFYKEIVKA